MELPQDRCGFDLLRRVLHCRQQSICGRGPARGAQDGICNIGCLDGRAGSGVKQDRAGGHFQQLGVPQVELKLDFLILFDSYWRVIQACSARINDPTVNVIPLFPAVGMAKDALFED